MKRKALFRKNEYAIRRELTVEFPFQDVWYSVKIDIETTPTFASIPCTQCKKSSRKILSEIGVSIPKDDRLVYILDVIANQHTKKIPHVFVITKVSTYDVHDVEAGLGWGEGSEVFKKIETHIKDILSGLVLCCSCSAPKHLTQLLKA